MKSKCLWAWPGFSVLLFALFASMSSATAQFESMPTDDVIELVEAAYKGNYSNFDSLKATIVRTSRDPSIQKSSVEQLPLGEGVEAAIFHRPEWRQVIDVLIQGKSERYDDKMPDWENILVVKDGVCTLYNPTHKMAHVFAYTREHRAHWPFVDLRNIGLFAPQDDFLAILNSGRIISAQIEQLDGGDYKARIEVQDPRVGVIGIECNSVDDWMPSVLYCKDPKGAFDYMARVRYQPYSSRGRHFRLPLHCDCYYGGGKKRMSLNPADWQSAPTTTVEVKDIAIDGPIPAAAFEIPNFAAGTRVDNLITKETFVDPEGADVAEPVNSAR